MTHTLANAIIGWTYKQTDGSHTSRTVLVYGAELLIENIIKVIGILLLGAVTGQLSTIVFTIFVFSSHRTQAGGRHCQTSLGCFAAMMIPCYTIVLAAPYITLTFPQTAVCFIFCLALNLRFAPYATENNPLGPARREKKRKNACLMILLWYAAAFIITPAYGTIIALATICETCTIIPYSKTKKSIQ